MVAWWCASLANPPTRPTSRERSTFTRWPRGCPYTPAQPDASQHRGSCPYSDVAGRSAFDRRTWTPTSRADGSGRASWLGTMAGRDGYDNWDGDDARGCPMARRARRNARPSYRRRSRSGSGGRRWAPSRPGLAAEASPLAPPLPASGGVENHVSNLLLGRSGSRLIVLRDAVLFRNRILEGQGGFRYLVQSAGLWYLDRGTDEGSGPTSPARSSARSHPGSQLSGVTPGLRRLVGAA